MTARKTRIEYPSFVPNLPGFRINPPVRSGLGAGGLTMVNGYPLFKDETKMKTSHSASSLRPFPARKPREQSPFAATASSMATSQSSSGLRASWLRHDRVVLCFTGYFKEAVHEKDGENFRVRKITLHYYMEDDTIQLTEHKFENSGIPQGHFLHRGKVVKNDEAYYTWKDLRLGESIEVYGRKIFLVKCDGATRRFLEMQGIDVGAEGEFAADPFQSSRVKFMQRETGADESVYRGAMMNPMKQFMEATLGKHIRAPEELSSFLANDRKVLRFVALWDDTGSVFGQVHHFDIHYYLTDDTLEILEVQQTNSGKDPFPKLLTRSKLPRDFRAAVIPLGSTRTPQQQRGGANLHWRDVRIGGTIPVYGRRLRVVGCDVFTRDWYERHGDPQPEAMEEEAPPVAESTMKIPPHNGFGSEEDSRQSCLHLNPKPARKDIEKLLANDKKTLRFSAHMNSREPTDAGRRFLITFYLADDTLAVYEPSLKNSGVLGGRFLKRKRYARGRTSSHTEGGMFAASDLFVGAEVSICGHSFRVADVDERSLCYMEAHPAQFPRSDVQCVMGRVVRALRDGSGGGDAGGDAQAHFQALPANGSGDVSVADVKAALRACFTPQQLDEQEVVTVLRALDPAPRRRKFNKAELLARLFTAQRPLTRSALEGVEGSGRPRSSGGDVGTATGTFGGRSATLGQMEASQARRAAEAAASRAERSSTITVEFRRAFQHQEGVLTQAFRMADTAFTGVLPLPAFKSALQSAARDVGFQISPKDTSALVGSFFPRHVTEVDYAQFTQELWR